MFSVQRSIASIPHRSFRQQPPAEHAFGYGLVQAVRFLAHPGAGMQRYLAGTRSVSSLGSGQSGRQRQGIVGQGSGSTLDLSNKTGYNRGKRGYHCLRAFGQRGVSDPSSKMSIKGKLNTQGGGLVIQPLLYF